MQLPHQKIALGLAVLWLLAGSVLAKDSDGSFDGRATYYTDNTQGSCRFGKPDTIYYAAWPNGQEGAPNCGKCFEVSCKNTDFHDGYGQQVQRSSACYDESKRVVVKIIDSCPCVHANYYSNQRWCCGDMEHIDLSADVFKMLANPQWGVIGAKFKETSCDKLGEVDGSSGGSSDHKGDDSSDQPVGSHDTSDKLDGHGGWDTAWIKQKVHSWDKVDDSDFEKHWQDSVGGTWLEKFKSESPSWVKSTFGGWRR